jgi:hypothetical protein
MRDAHFLAALVSSDPAVGSSLRAAGGLDGAPAEVRGETRTAYVRARLFIVEGDGRRSGMTFKESPGSSKALARRLLPRGDRLKRSSGKSAALSLRSCLALAVFSRLHPKPPR